jgi:hypothetical protein
MNTFSRKIKRGGLLLVLLVAAFSPLVTSAKDYYYQYQYPTPYYYQYQYQTPYPTPYQYQYQYQTPYPSPYATPYGYQYPSPYGTPYGYQTPYATPYGTPYGYQTPYATPYGYQTPSYPYPTPYSTPYITPYGTPYSTPYGYQYPTPYQTPYQTPRQYCSPGYWKQSHHFHSYVGYSPYTQFGSVFENAFPGMNLIQVLWQGGGGLNMLGRHTVAALLNSTALNSGLTTGQVINIFNNAFPGGNYQAVASQLTAAENCPLN